MVNKVKGILIILNKSAIDAFATASKKAIKKTAEATGDLIDNKITDRITKSQKFHNRIFQKQLKLSMIKNT